jgi:ribosomal protein L40E
MAKRSDSVIGSGIALVLGVVFVLFWVGMAASHGAPAFFRQLRYQGTWFLGFDRTSALPAERQTAPAESLVCDYCGALNTADARQCARCGSSKLVPRKADHEP